MKGILKVMGIIIGLIIIFIGFSYINHKIHLSKEDELFVPNGEMVYLNCSHYVHDIEYKKIADETKKIIENLD